MTHAAHPWLKGITATSPRSAFTLAEALVAITIISVVGASLLLAVEASLRTTSDTLERTVAQGIAEQLLDEIVGLPFKERSESAYQSVLGPETGEAQVEQQRRDLFDDIDDYHNFTTFFPLKDAWGVPLGQGDGEGDLRHPAFRVDAAAFDSWYAEVKVAYVDATDHSAYLPAGNTSDYRRITVRLTKHVNGSTYALAEAERVIAYVPPSL